MGISEKRADLKSLYVDIENFRFKYVFLHLFYGVRHQYDSIGHQHGINDHVDVQGIRPHNHRDVSRLGWALDYRHLRMSEFTTSEKLTEELVCSINFACLNLIFLSRSASSIIVTLFEANNFLLYSYMINQIMHYSL